MRTNTRHFSVIPVNASLLKLCIPVTFSFSNGITQVIHQSGSYLKFQFHASDCVPKFGLCEFLYVIVEVSGWNLSVPALYCLQQCVVYEDVLILRLHHVITLGTKAGHMTINVHGFFQFDAL